MDDDKIVDLIYAHAEDGLKEASDKYGRLLFSVVTGILPGREDAEECVNDAYMKIWSIIPPYRPTHLRSFLCRISRQTAIDRYRIAHRKKDITEKTVSLDELGEDFPDESVDRYSVGELGDAINEFLSGLDAESRVLFIRRYFLMESQKSLAERFGMTENLVGVRLFRARAKLKKHLEKRGINGSYGKN